MRQAYNDPPIAKTTRAYSLIYSNNRKYRLLRHLLFWMAWFLYFISIYSYRKGSEMIGLESFLQYTFIELFILLSVDVLFCYSVIYFLLPRFLLKGKYFLFFLFLCVFMLLDVSLSDFYYYTLINPLREIFHLPPFQNISLQNLLMGMSGVLMIAGSATTIKFLKMWQIKNQELQLLKSEKISTELKFIDTFIQPSFLPVMLKKIYSFSLSTPHKVPEMLECLQRILQYLIHDCSQSRVPLDKEIESIRDFLILEKLTNPERLNINFECTGDANRKQIVPFILFPLIENNFRQVNDNISEKHWTTISLLLRESDLNLEIKNSKPVETSNLMSYETSTLQQIRKRLEMLYPKSHKMNITIEEECFIINLKIDLNSSVM